MNHDEIKKKIREYTGDYAQEKEQTNNGIAKFDNDKASVKNVCFVLLDGKHIFLNYNYLIAGEFISEANKIVLHFTTHVITLTGKNLEKLYQDFMQHIPKIVIAIDERYSEISQMNSPVVTEIEVK
ncbi:hypothetical protein [Flavobacterium lindanitolerans]|uniref:hypothetical protein n=1 Tax=Flavobacterium lindanitolerans TaxID=428988 RepID=UPI0027BA9CCE|nr:hypothetical protein [Flavobacterium lindanitolerans]